VRGYVIGSFGVVSLCLSAWLGRVDLLYAGLLLVLIPLIAMIVIVLDRPSLTVRRSFTPAVVAVDEEAVASIEVRNQAGRPTPMLSWRDSLPDGMSFVDAFNGGEDGDRAGWHPEPFTVLGEHALASRDHSDTAQLRYRLGTARRGAFQVGPLLLRRTDPFGLAWGEYRVGRSKPLLVTPRAVPLARGTLDTARSEGAQHEILHQGIPSADELTAREYRTGDPLRRVNWRATARHDTLMVRQEEQRSNPEAWILLDTKARHRHGHAAHAEDDAFEQEVELVAALAAHLLDEGYSLNVVETGRPQLEGDRAIGGSGLAGVASFGPAGGVQLLLAGLAAIERVSEPGRPSADSLAIGLRRSGRGSPLFAVLGDGLLASTDRDTTADLDAIGTLRQFADPAVAFLTGSHVPAAASVLTNAGWVCVGVGEDDGPEESWDAALRGYSVIASDSTNG
jgi:uncharacterized protein (DUF58 family)